MDNIPEIDIEDVITRTLDMFKIKYKHNRGYEGDSFALERGFTLIGTAMNVQLWHKGTMVVSAWHDPDWNSSFEAVVKCLAPYTAPVTTNPDIHKDWIREACEVFIVATAQIECQHCGEVTDYENDFHDKGDEDAVMSEAVDIAYRNGWRVCESENYQCISLICPNCMKNEGEDDDWVLYNK